MDTPFHNPDLAPSEAPQTIAATPIECDEWTLAEEEERALDASTAKLRGEETVAVARAETASL